MGFGSVTQDGEIYIGLFIQSGSNVIGKGELLEAMGAGKDIRQVT
jgi:hypothetical protein